MARYGQILPERVLQTIASSPQDMNYTSTVTGNSRGSSPPAMPPPPLPVTPPCRVDTADSDSGCSTTDDELCDITNKIAATAGLLPTPIGVCSHKVSPNCSTSKCACSYTSDSELDAMFAMDPNPETELDLDMIENN